MLKRLKSGAIILSLFALRSSFAVESNKFDVGFGYFGVTAKTASSSGSTSGLGLYQLNYRRTISPRFEVAVGFTIYFAGLISGDSGSGLDLGTNYFPFTFTGPVESNQNGSSFALEESWRPYLGITFNQRSFQSVQATYTGFGAHLGLEHSLSAETNVSAVVRTIKLSGPRNSTATENDFFLALGYKF